MIVHAAHDLVAQSSDTHMHIPAPMKEAVENGTAVLMLGSGASLAARDANGKRPPTASELAKVLCTKFLSPDYANLPLTQVADYAISESSLFEVQDFIRELMLPFEPSKSHKLLSTFRWRAIVTTNYDQLIEKAYSSNASSAQNLVPLFANTDRWDDVLRNNNYVPLLKLHGCISKTRDDDCQLILSTEQYITFEHGRSRLFRQFQEFAAERSFIYIGFSNTDPDIRSLVQKLDAEKVGRPRSFLITPSVDDIAQRYWAARGTTAIRGTLEETATALDSTIGHVFRGLCTESPAGGHPICGRFTSSTTVLSEAATKSLEIDIEYVKAAVASPTCNAMKFYSGVSQSWAAISQSLDVRRRLHDTLLQDYFLDENPDEFRFIVIKAHAGAGKSVFLRRLAWEATHDFNRLCLFAYQDASLSSVILQELATATKEHIYLFIDDVLQHRNEIDSLLHGLGSATKWLTIIAGARTNEWNSAAPQVQALATEEHVLPYLSESELDNLLDKLCQHNALQELQKVPPLERKEKLRQRAGRQLLVALHEATSGRRFEEILHDEYSRLSPNTAKTLYLSICFLNQFNVPVRAGLLSRRFGISFEDFKNKLFAPLEEVVITNKRKGDDDYFYVARHSHVAEIVVRNELTSADDLFNEYIATLQHLNVGYLSDKQAFQKLLQGKRLAIQFSDSSMVERIFKAAKEAMGPEDAYILQQMALFEMHRESGSLSKAKAFLERAMELAPHSRIIKHSLAELLIRKAESARNDLEKLHSLSLAEDICRELKKGAQNSYAHTTLVKAGLARLRRAAESEEVLKAEDVEGLIKAVEKDLEDGLRSFPGDAHLLGLEAELAKLLAESDRVARALKQSFAKSPRNGYIAWQLAMLNEKQGNIGEAQRVLKDALDANRANTRLHLAYGKLLLRHGLGTNDDLIFHFRHAFSPGDSNHEAQLLYGRQLFVNGEIEKSKDEFRVLGRALLPNSVKRSQIFPLECEFEGMVLRVEAWYCLIQRDGDGVVIRFDLQDAGELTWLNIARGGRVRFGITFTMFGPRAINVRFA